ncbi:MAG: ATP-binding cassette domain-containing protein, partial [Candidatus Omnitrophica bacterium]|nr:ATP-binding cassette domain-containing protein [Candidatus Omnitrophota bacterium]
KVVEKKRKQLERFTQRFHAQPNRAAAVRNKRKMIDKLEEIELPQNMKSVGEFEFEDIPQSGYVVSTLSGIRKAYGEKVVYDNLDLEIIRGQKMCLVGPNGAGKSTLLKMLAGAIKPDKGSIKDGHEVNKGYFSQARIDVLNPNSSAFDEVINSAPQGTPALKVRSLLGLFNFHGDDVFKQVKVLSGGEKSRLILAKLLINPPNFMLLDEPTTHLDLDGVKALTSAFKKYTGTVCFISHDLYFIREIADHMVEVNNGELKTYHGGLDYYLEKKHASPGAGGKTAKKDHIDLPKNKNLFGSSEQLSKQQEEEKAQMQELRRQHKEAKKRLTQIKTEIQKLETEKKDLETESYVKSRKLTESYERRDSNTIKEFGQRLKDIQSRLRAIETEIKELVEERQRISK